MLVFVERIVRRISTGNISRYDRLIAWCRPQVQFGTDAKRQAQRRFVELTRVECWGFDTLEGVYVTNNISHHVLAAVDSDWIGRSQAVSWLDDHRQGNQTPVALATAVVLPTEELAMTAEAKGHWFQAGLRWSAHGTVLAAETGIWTNGSEFIRKAATALAKAGSVAQTSVDTNTTSGASSAELAPNVFSVRAKETLEMKTLMTILKGKLRKCPSCDSVQCRRHCIANALAPLSLPTLGEGPLFLFVSLYLIMFATLAAG